MNLAVICSRCEKSTRNCRGPLACTVDGKDIIEHARDAYCPLGKFDPNAKPEPAKPKEIPCTGQLNQPGSMVKAILASLGITAGPNCGCEAFCRKMNQWGWKGCAANMPEIVKWFAAKAVEADVVVSTLAIAKAVLRSLKHHRIEAVDAREDNSTSSPQ